MLGEVVRTTRTTTTLCFPLRILPKVIVYAILLSHDLVQAIIILYQALHK